MFALPRDVEPVNQSPCPFPLGERSGQGFYDQAEAKAPDWRRHEGRTGNAPIRSVLLKIALPTSALRIELGLALPSPAAAALLG